MFFLKENKVSIKEEKFMQGALSVSEVLVVQAQEPEL